MSQRHRDLLLLCAAADRTFRFNGNTWVGKCIHCRRKLSLDGDGRPAGGTTLEHIVPRHHGGDDALNNLAIASSRCNGQKGRQLDNRRRDDPQLRTVINTLRQRRAERQRPLVDHGCHRLRTIIDHQVYAQDND